MAHVAPDEDKWGYCKRAPQGYYSPNPGTIGMEGLTQCPQGYFTEEPGAISQNQCKSKKNLFSRVFLSISFSQIHLSHIPSFFIRLFLSSSFVFAITFSLYSSLFGLFGLSTKEPYTIMLFPWHRHHHLCTPPSAIGLNIEASYLLHVCTCDPHICTSNI